MPRMEQRPVEAATQSTGRNGSAGAPGTARDRGRAGPVSPGAGLPVPPFG
jgi:hypothetical protein